MRVIGYAYPDGFALCTDCANHEEVTLEYGPEEIHPIFDTDETDDLTCDKCLEVIE